MRCALFFVKRTLLSDTNRLSGGNIVDQAKAIAGQSNRLGGYHPLRTLAAFMTAIAQGPDAVRVPKRHQTKAGDMGNNRISPPDPLMNRLHCLENHLGAELIIN